MRRHRVQPLSEVMKAYFKARRFDRPLQEIRLINNWENILGSIVARSTHNIYIHKEILYVSLNSSVLRSELQMVKEGLIKALNDSVGEVIIKDIVLR